MLSASGDRFQALRLPKRRFGLNRPNSYVTKQVHLSPGSEHCREAHLAKGPHAGSTGRVKGCWRLANPLFFELCEYTSQESGGDLRDGRAQPPQASLSRQQPRSLSSTGGLDLPSTALAGLGDTLPTSAIECTYCYHPVIGHDCSRHPELRYEPSALDPSAYGTL